MDKSQLFLSALLCLIAVEDIKMKKIFNSRILVGIGIRLLLVGPELKRAIGIVMMTAFLWTLSKLYYRFRSRKGFSGGDVKLMGLIQLYLGLTRTCYVMLLAGILMLLFRRKYNVPLAPFLGAAAIAVEVLI